QNPNLVFPTASGFTTYSIEKLGPHHYAPEAVYVTKFDNSGKDVSSVDIALPKRSGKDATLLKVIEGDNKLYIFSHVAVKKDGKNVLYAQVYNNVTDEVSGVKDIVTLPIAKVNNSGFFNIAISEDKSTLAVLVNEPFKKKTNEGIQVLTLDADLQEKSKAVHQLSFESERAYTETLFVENDAKVNIVKKIGLHKKEPKTTLITINGEDKTEQQISADGFYISDTEVVSINGKHYLLGFATDNAKPVVSMGGAKDNSYFLYDISDQKLIKHQEWSRETIKRVLGKGYIGLKVKTVFIDNDDIYLVGDCYSKHSEPIEGKNFEYNYRHWFGPGVMIKLNTSGEVMYETPLTYGEAHYNDMKYLGSFFPFLKDGKLHILANVKESKLKNKKIVFGHGKINARVIVLHSFDDEGNMNTLPFWESQTGGAKMPTKFSPSQTLKLSDKVFYMYATGNESHKFGTMTLN
ncbi:MAG: hypothetical protein AAF901_00750, partial [Bacteroidota bacterium]